MARILSTPRQNVKFALFALSGNECAFPDCDAPLWEDGTIVGDICHIHAQHKGGPRYSEGLSDDELHSIGNLILLCRKHHKIVDDHPEEYDAASLKTMKAGHESRAATTSAQVLRRLVEALAPDVPDNWWDRPGAPVFRLNLASTRPPSGSWRFEVGLEQIGGGDIGKLSYQYRLDRSANDPRAPELRSKRTWRLSDLTLQPEGRPLELEFRFWWDGAERSLTYRWESEAAFQKSEAAILRS